MGWKPIGGDGPQGMPYFRAIFDGQGNTISNLYINRPGHASVGLFGGNNDTSVIRNMVLIGPEVTGGDIVGALVAQMKGEVRDSIVSGGSVSGDEYVGGMFGSMVWSTVSGSGSSARVTGTNKYTGGLAGAGYGSDIASSRRTLTATR
jgi:hypothetical protein